MLSFKKLTLFAPFLALILSVSLSSAYAQDNNQNTEQHQLTLKVVDAESREALRNAEVQILGIYEPHTPDNEGQVIFDAMATDPHTFQISADGYETWKKTLTVTKDSQLTVELKPTG